MNKGVVSVLVAYLIWGLYPFYFHAMRMSLLPKL